MPELYGDAWKYEYNTEERDKAIEVLRATIGGKYRNDDPPTGGYLSREIWVLMKVEAAARERVEELTKDVDDGLAAFIGRLIVRLTIACGNLIHAEKQIVDQEALVAKEATAMRRVEHLEDKLKRVTDERDDYRKWYTDLKGDSPED